MKIPKILNAATTIVGISFGNSLAYRATFFLRLVFLFLTLISHILFWKYVYSVRSSVGDYQFNEMVIYLFLTHVLYAFNQTDGLNISDSIRQGELDRLLILPYSYILLVYWRFLGNRLAFAASAALVILVTYLVTLFSLGEAASFSPLKISVGLFYIYAGVTIHFMIDTIIGMLAFWFEKSDFLFVVKETILWIVSGLWLPFEMLGERVAAVLDFLPFKYLAYFPAQFFVSEGQIQIRDILNIVISCFVLAVLTSIVWKKGLKRYEAYGS